MAPRLLHEVISVITEYGGQKGTSLGEITSGVRRLLRDTPSAVPPRYLTMEVRSVLTHCIQSGLVNFRAGKFRLNISPKTIAALACPREMRRSYRKRRRQSTYTRRRPRRPASRRRRRSPSAASAKSSDTSISVKTTESIKQQQKSTGRKRARQVTKRNKKEMPKHKKARSKSPSKKADVEGTNIDVDSKGKAHKADAEGTDKKEVQRNVQSADSVHPSNDKPAGNKLNYDAAGNFSDEPSDSEDATSEDKPMDYLN